MDTAVRVLVVEEDDAVRHLLETIGRLRRCSTTAVAHPAPASELVRAGRGFDLILASHIEGADAVNFLRIARKSLPSATIVLVAAALSNEEMASVEREGVDAIVLKPFNVEALYRLIEGVARCRE
ncbi:MAG: response regulator [Planctomycetes bacterium]|nr:response regulator [Planctomycetota bacterium]